ncbi:hypothetical protein [Oceanobacillus chungangensis]|nr:hypothetical protein [Oceanobacillus chungangensis]
MNCYEVKKVGALMEKGDKTYISFGAQMGDVNADKAVAPHLRKLRRLLD